MDDALKFVQREARRGAKYDGIILDPPKFGRGPKGEVWEVYKSLPDLLSACRECLSASFTRSESTASTSATAPCDSSRR